MLSDQSRISSHRFSHSRVSSDPHPLTQPLPRERRSASLRIGLVFILTLFAVVSCSSKPRELVLYTSVDEPYARPIVDQFTHDTGIAVKLVTDTEATKSVGLAERLRAEKQRPRCDVFWGNEIFNTVLLADEGLLAPYDSPSAKDIRRLFRDKQNRWTAIGIRARVIALSDQINTIHIHPELLARHMSDLTAPMFKGQVAIARPTAGTTGGQVAALYALWGEQQADAYFHALHDNGIVVLGGNSEVANQVAIGNILIGVTDNDDAANTRVNGRGIHSVLPDQKPDEIGTLAVPTTVSLVQRDDLDPRAKQLVDYLLSAAIEQKLIDVKFAGWSVRAPETSFHAMNIDYAEVAKIMPQAIPRATAILEGH